LTFKSFTFYINYRNVVWLTLKAGDNHIKKATSEFDSISGSLFGKTFKDLY